MVATEDQKIWIVIWIIVCPPTAVALMTRDGTQAAINLLLCFLFYIPGIVHAVWLFMKSDEYRPAVQ
ncbi:unnamed protein product, partial [Mesorhabditis spiculigera]